MSLNALGPEELIRVLQTFLKLGVKQGLEVTIEPETTSKQPVAVLITPLDETHENVIIHGPDGACAALNIRACQRFLQQTQLVVKPLSLNVQVKSDKDVYQLHVAVTTRKDATLDSFLAQTLPTPACFIGFALEHLPKACSEDVIFLLLNTILIPYVNTLNSAKLTLTESVEGKSQAVQVYHYHSTSGRAPTHNNLAKLAVQKSSLFQSLPPRVVALIWDFVGVDNAASSSLASAAAAPVVLTSLATKRPRDSGISFRATADWEEEGALDGENDVLSEYMMSDLYNEFLKESGAEQGVLDFETHADPTMLLLPSSVLAELQSVLKSGQLSKFGESADIEAEDGHVVLKVERDLKLRDKFVIVVQRISVKHPRKGLGKSIIQTLINHFQKQRRFSALKLEQVMSGSGRGLAKAFGMQYDGKQNYWYELGT